LILAISYQLQGQSFKLYDKAQPFKATQLLDLYHGVNEPMALPAVAHGSKSQ